MSLSLSSTAALFTSLALNSAKSSIPVGRIKGHSKACWSAEVEGVVRERRKVFAAAYRSEDCQAYISALQRASSVIAKAKAEAWQTTCSSLSHKSNPKFVYSLLRSIAGFPSSSSSSPNFPNWSSPRESASVYAAYLRSHFSVSQPKSMRNKAIGYFPSSADPLFPFQQAQYVQIFPLKPAPFCMFFAGLGSTNRPATSLLLLSDYRSSLSSLPSPPSFLLFQTLWQMWQELSSLSSCFIRLQ